MAKVNPDTGEDQLVEAERNRDEALALAWRSHNELIEIAWRTYETTRAQAQAVYEVAENDIKLKYEAAIESVLVETAVKPDPPPTLLPGADAADAERGDGPEVPLQILSSTGAGHTDNMEPNELTKGKLSPDSIFLLELRKLNDGLISYQESIGGLELLANESGRNAGEIKVIMDGLQAARDLALDWNSMGIRLAEEILGESKKGDDSYEVNESGG